MSSPPPPLPLMCAICYEDFAALPILECEHQFCYRCITDWQCKRVCDAVCPMCSKPLKLSEHDPVKRALRNARVNQQDWKRLMLVRYDHGDAAALKAIQDSRLEMRAREKERKAREREDRVVRERGERRERRERLKRIAELQRRILSGDAVRRQRYH
jgi:hypothetical protein